jgi:anti-anti-sigma factor
MVPMPFTMWAGEHDGVLLVRFAGRLESPWADEVYRILVRRSPTALWLDLSMLTAIDPPGLATLVAIRQDVVAGGGRFVLRGARDTVRATFAAAGLDALEDDERVAVTLAVASTVARVSTILSLAPAAPVAPTAPADGTRARPVTQLPLKGGRGARRSPAGTPKVA